MDTAAGETQYYPFFGKRQQRKTTGLHPCFYGMAERQIGTEGGIMVTAILSLIKVFVLYLLQPISFLLTFFLPIAVYFINRKYVWLSLLFTLCAELIINWENFCYYESRGLMTLFMLGQIAIIAIIILLLRAVPTKRKR